jgi:hypothetical protein
MVVAVLAVLAMAWLAGSSAVPASAAPGCTQVNVIGDSLTSIGQADLRAALADVGWTAVHVNAAASRSVFYKASRDPYTGLEAVDRLRSTSGDTACWIVALGTNDVGLWDESEYSMVIRTMLDRIGPDRQVLWVNVYKGARPSWQSAWNSALVEVEAQRPRALIVFDWAAIMAQHPEWAVSDQTHYTAAGNVARAAAIAEASRHLGGSASLRAQPIAFERPAVVPDGAAGRLVPIGPSRVFDTRAAAPLASAEMRAVALGGLVPPGAVAAAVNIAAVDPSAPGYLTAFPCDGEVPPTSNVNFLRGRDTSSTAIVALDGRSQLCVTASATTHVIVDVTAAFVPSRGAGFVATPPERVLDTRSGARLAQGATISVGVGDASAVWLNMTVADTAGDGYISVFPCDGGMPATSTVNFSSGRPALANTAVIPVGATGRLCIHTSAPAHVIVDVTGRFFPEGGMPYQPVLPIRVLDTRSGAGGWLGRIAAGQTITVPVAPGTSPGVVAVGNMTAIETGGSGYLTAWDGTVIPPTSNLNFISEEVRPNVVASRIGSDGNFHVFSSGNPGAIAFDLVGWFTPDEISAHPSGVRTGPAR